MRIFCCVLVLCLEILFFSCDPQPHCTTHYLFKGKVSNPENDSLTIEITKVGDAIFEVKTPQTDKGYTKGNDFFVEGDYYTVCDSKVSDLKESNTDFIISITRSGGELIEKRLDKNSFSFSENDSLSVIDIGFIDLRN